MKKILYTLLIATVFVATTNGQAKKPTIMVVPSDNFCITNSYTQEFDVNGKKEMFPDYKKALQNNSDLRLVITKLGALMAERGFPLKDLEQELKNLSQEEAELSVMTSKSGAMVNENPIDMLKRTAKADIIMDLDFKIVRQGPEKYITFNLKGLDAYTSKQIAGVAGAGKPSSSASPELLLEEAVLSHMDNFNGRLQSYFDNLFEQGREVKLVVRVFEGTDVDLEEEYDINGEMVELGFAIEDWMADNTKSGRFNTASATASIMKFDQVRIPLYKEVRGRKRAIDTRAFARELRKYLRSAPFNIEAKIYQRGLGEAWLILGEK